MTNEEKQQIANEVCKWLKSNIYNYTSMSMDVDYDVVIERGGLLEDLEKEILKDYKERQKIFNHIYNWLRFNIYDYASMDVDYEVCIEMDDLLKDLEAEILKEE